MKKERQGLSSDVHTRQMETRLLYTAFQTSISTSILFVTMDANSITTALTTSGVLFEGIYTIELPKHHRDNCITFDHQSNMLKKLIIRAAHSRELGNLITKKCSMVCLLGMHPKSGNLITESEKSVKLEVGKLKRK